MAFFDNLGKKIGSAAEATASKAKEVAEVTKLNSKVNEEERTVEKLYLEIGKAIYQADKDNPESVVFELLSKVTSSLNTVEQLKAKIEEVKNS